MTPVSRAVLVTGCSSGIGRATADRLAGAGWTVYATARRRGSIEELERRGCRLLELDVTDESSMRAAVETVEAEEGAVGVLVNNAGYSQSGALETVPLDDARRQFETNVFGVLQMCQLCLPSMRRQRWGKVVNVSSMGGRFTFPGAGVYHATKHAVEAISDALRFELQALGVHVIVVEPGLIRTRFAETAVESIAESPGDTPYADFNADVARATAGVYQGPVGRLGGEPAAVARVIETAIAAQHPRARYAVTPSAKLLLALRALLPDRGWDAFLRTQFPHPTAVEAPSSRPG